MFGGKQQVFPGEKFVEKFEKNSLTNMGLLCIIIPVAEV
jgi:hypothetical protein